MFHNTHMFHFKIYNSPKPDIFSSYMLFEQNVFIMTRSYHEVCKIKTVYVIQNYELSVQELCLPATVTHPLIDKHSTYSELTDCCG